MSKLFHSELAYKATYGCQLPDQPELVILRPKEIIWDSGRLNCVFLEKLLDWSLFLSGVGKLDNNKICSDFKKNPYDFLDLGPYWSGFIVSSRYLLVTGHSTTIVLTQLEKLML